MEHKFTKSFAMAIAVVMGLSSQSQATEFWDIAAAKFATTTLGTDVYRQDVNTLVNQANVRAVWFENVANGGLQGVFDSLDTLIGTLDIYDRNGTLVLQSPPALSRAQVDAWAATNAAAIFSALFPAGISEMTGATDDDILVSTTVSQNIFKKVAPTKKNQNNTEAAKNEVAEADAVYHDLKVNGYNGRATSMVLGIAKSAGSGFSYSLTVPYRWTVVNDDLGSSSRFLGMELAAKYPLIKGDSSDWNLGGCLFGSAYSVKTVALDKSGNLKYGGGIFTSVNQDLGFGSLGVGLDYRIAKAYMPASMNSDALFFDQAADYVNHHSPVQTISYGFNLGMPVAGDAAAVNFEVIRSNFVSDDIPDGLKAKTSVNLGCSFYPSETFELNLGIGRDFEIDRVDSMGIKLGVIHRF